MGRINISSWKGLSSAPNSLHFTDYGGLQVADNCIIVQKDRIEGRPGFDQTAAIPSGSVIVGMFTFNRQPAANASGLIVAMDDGTMWTYSSSRSAWDAITVQDFTNATGAAVLPPDGLAIRPGYASACTYFTSTRGTMKIASWTPPDPGPSTNFAQPSGLSQPSTLVVSIDAGGTAIAAASAVAYRATFAAVDGAGNFLESSPSARAVITNTAGAPRAMDASMFLQTDAEAGITIARLWRSKQYDQSVVTVSPDDQLFLVAQKFVSSSDISAGFVTFVDNQPEALLYQTPLYTNAISVEESFDRPPIAYDLETYRELLWFFNTTEPQAIEATLIGVGGGTGLNVGDFITVAGVVFTGIASAPAASKQFVVTTGGTPAQNIEATARDLCRSICLYFSQATNPAPILRVYASYASGFNQAPGVVDFTEMGVGGATFQVSSSRVGAWSPDLPQTSDNQAEPNAAFYSQPSQADAVPNDANSLFVSQADKKVIRAIRLGQTLFVFKEDALYKIVGFTESDFAVSEVNPEIRLISPNAVCIMSSTIFCMTRQGVHALTEGGTVLISKPIDDLVKSLVAQINLDPGSARHIWAAGKEKDHIVVFGVPTSTSDPEAGQQWCFCVPTGAWTTWSITNTNLGFSDLNSQLFIAVGNRVWFSRETGTHLDAQDPSQQLSLFGVSGLNTTQLVFTAYPNLQVGDVLTQGTIRAIVTGVASDPSTVATTGLGTVITLDGLYTWDITQPVTCYTGIESTIQINPIYDGDTETLKDWKESYATFIRNDAAFIGVETFTEASPQQSVQQRPLAPAVPWGDFAWGEKAFGGKTALDGIVAQILSPGFGSSKVLNLTLELGQAQAPWALGSLSINYDVVSDKAQKSGGQP